MIDTAVNYLELLINQAAEVDFPENFNFFDRKQVSNLLDVNSIPDKNFILHSLSVAQDEAKRNELVVNYFKNIGDIVLLELKNYLQDFQVSGIKTILSQLEFYVDALREAVIAECDRLKWPDNISYEKQQGIIKTFSICYADYIIERWKINLKNQTFDPAQMQVHECVFELLKHHNDNRLDQAIASNEEIRKLKQAFDEAQAFYLKLRGTPKLVKTDRSMRTYKGLKKQTIRITDTRKVYPDEKEYNEVEQDYMQKSSSTFFKRKKASKPKSSPNDGFFTKLKNKIKF